MKNSLTYTETVIGTFLGRIKPSSFYRWCDKNCLTKTICLNYLSNKGSTIDQVVSDINEHVGEDFVTEQDIVDFILTYTKNPVR